MDSSNMNRRGPPISPNASYQENYQDGNNHNYQDQNNNNNSSNSDLYEHDPPFNTGTVGAALRENINLGAHNSFKGDFQDFLSGQVNPTLVVPKVFYFFFFAAFGSVFPLMGIYFKQMGTCFFILLNLLLSKSFYQGYHVVINVTMTFIKATMNLTNKAMTYTNHNMIFTNAKMKFTKDIMVFTKFTLDFTNAYITFNNNTMTFTNATMNFTKDSMVFTKVTLDFINAYITFNNDTMTFTNHNMIFTNATMNFTKAFMVFIKVTYPLRFFSYNSYIPCQILNYFLLFYPIFIMLSYKDPQTLFQLHNSLITEHRNRLFE